MHTRKEVTTYILSRLAGWEKLTEQEQNSFVEAIMHHSVALSAGSDPTRGGPLYRVNGTHRSSPMYPEVLDELMDRYRMLAAEAAGAEAEVYVEKLEWTRVDD